jgi:hypothetical protein
LLQEADRHEELAGEELEQLNALLQLVRVAEP